MLLKHSHDENDEFMKLTPFWLEKIKELDAEQQLDFIRSVFIYIQNAINLTKKYQLYLPKFQTIQIKLP